MSGNFRYICCDSPVAPTFGDGGGNGGEREGKLEANLAGSHRRAKDMHRPGAGGFLAQNF